jgi:DNA-binding HxlR family transcriptional regulator
VGSAQDTAWFSRYPATGGADRYRAGLEQRRREPADLRAVRAEDEDAPLGRDLAGPLEALTAWAVAHRQDVQDARKVFDERNVVGD